MTLRLVVAVGVLGILYGIFPVAPVAAATDKLPDLEVARTHDFRIQRTSSGRRLLRFSGLMLNVGRGPLEIRADRASTKAPWAVDQIIDQTNGATRRVPTTATMKYAGDGHNHWHVTRMLTYHIWSATGGQSTLHAAKIGFCFFDTNKRNTSLPGAPRARHYQQTGCGKVGSLHVKVGISVGWADLYPANFVYQWIDITGLPAGTYTVRGAIDLGGKFLESSEKNNCTYTRISFGATGSKVKVLGTGSKCVNDHDSTPYAADITWAVAAGIAADCDADMFCTYDPTTRDQLASFIARAMKLPAATKDFFTDDNGSAHEADINKVAAAGLMKGCGPTTFCPNGNVTRGAIATVLALALKLPAATKDFFTDDATSPDQANINKVAQAGIMAGCTATTFCPTVTVKRGETMKFLHKAFGAPPQAVAGALRAVGLDPNQLRSAVSLEGAPMLRFADTPPAGGVNDPDESPDPIATTLGDTAGLALTCVIAPIALAETP